MAEPVETLEYRMDRVEERLRAIETKQDAVIAELHAFSAGFRAIKWLGGALLAVWMVAKTGDVTALKSLFGGG